MDYAKAVGVQQGLAGAQQLNKPKELGILQRVDGMRGGLQDLRKHLENLFDRMDGNAGEKAANANIVAASLSGTLSDAENELRICLGLVGTLNDRF